MIKADCMEVYLFRQNVMVELGQHWTSFLLVYLLAFSIMLSLLVVILIRKPPNITIPVWLQIYIIAYLVCFIGLPLLCIAHANYGADKLLTKIFLAAGNDYAAIGGRDKWVKYIGTNSAYWSFLGVPVTYNLLVAITSFLIASGGLAAGRVFGSDLTGSDDVSP